MEQYSDYAVLVRLKDNIAYVLMSAADTGALLSQLGIDEAEVTVKEVNEGIGQMEHPLLKQHFENKMIQDLE